jgi:hypothetical protein
MPRISLHFTGETDKMLVLRTFLLAFSATVLTLAILLAAGAHAANRQSGITLGPISVSGTTAVVTGTVGGEPDATVSLDVNGRPVGIDAAGHFAAAVDLDHTSVVVLTLAGPHGQVTVLRIPVTLLGHGADHILGDLEAAGIVLVVPPDGFRMVDGAPPHVTGRVLDRSKLLSLTINGQEILGLTGPSGFFSLLLPGESSSQQVTVFATDHQGVSESTTYPLTQLTSVIRTSSGTSVSAAGARGVVIAKIRFDRRRLLTYRRLGVTVKVKDRRGYVIRGAALRLRGMPAKYLATGGARVGFTNRVGIERFVYRLQKRAFTDHLPRMLTLRVRAGTPTASVAKIVRVRLPMLPAT